MLNKPEDLRELKPRFQVFVVIVLLAFAAVAGRLFQLQVLEGEHFARRAERNFIETIEVDAPRGRIFDAKGRPLATNRPAYTLYVTARPRVAEPDDGSVRSRKAGGAPKRAPVEDAQIEELVSLLEFVDEDDKAQFVARIEELREDEVDGRYAVAIRSNLSPAEYARIETRGHFAGWVEIRKSARRWYPEGDLTAFITGYMREISADELASNPHAGYRAGDRVGKTGIERQWENYLRGRAGSMARVVNYLGAPVKVPPPSARAALPEPREPIPGQDVHLSIDVDMQRVAAEAFAGRRAGGLVAMEVRTGRILAMLSVPSIDPNRWEGPITRGEYQEWLESPFKPFVDKTVQENYFPGSTYKIVSALAMLEDPNYDPDELVDCGPYVEYGGRKFKDTHTCGPVDLREAIVQSCNVYFYKLAMERDLTLSKMEQMARRLGLGERTGLGINGETPGTIPTEASENRQGSFQQGVRLLSAIGQGNVKATVLQIAVLYAAIANGGFIVTPSLVDRIETFDGSVVLETEPQYKSVEPVIEEIDRRRIHEGLVGVVATETGTAYSQRLESVSVAGKTGTAQVGRERQIDDPVIEGWDTTQDHAWFAAYAPANDPEIVVVALVAHGGTGADAAAPIVMRVIDHYLGTGRATREGKVAPRVPGQPPPLPGERAADGEAASSAAVAAERGAASSRGGSNAGDAASKLPGASGAAPATGGAR